MLNDNQDQPTAAAHAAEPAPYCGHAPQRAFLQHLLQQSALPQTLLLSGPVSVGKATLAWQLAHCLLGGTTTLPDTVISLQRSLSSLYICQPPLGQNLKIDDIRAIQSFLWLKQPPSAGPRVVIIDAASDLQPNAQSVLLKTLEEPKENSYFILVNHTPSPLLPTIRSRCHEILLNHLPPQALQEILLAHLHDTTFLNPAILSVGDVSTALLLAADHDSLYPQVVKICQMALLPTPDHYRLLQELLPDQPEATKSRVYQVSRLLDLLLQRSCYWQLAPSLLHGELVPDEYKVLKSLGTTLPDCLSARKKLHDVVRASKTFDLGPEQVLNYLFHLLTPHAQ